MSRRLLRVTRIIELIRRQRYPDVARLCELFEIKRRTLHEDISFIRNELRLEIKFDRFKGGYYDANPSIELPKFDLTEEELFYLRLSSQAFLEQSNFAFELILESAIDKIAKRANTNSNYGNNHDNSNSSICFRNNHLKSFASWLFEDLLFACRNSVLTTISYATIGQPKESIRKIEPYRILVRNNSWYLIAYCLAREELRIFALHRIREYKLHKESFAARNELNIDAWLGSAFQIEHGDGLHQVTIRFEKNIAPYLKEKLWHPKQEQHENNDGSYILTLPTTSLNEIKRWILYYGSQAEVLEPQILRDMLKTEAESMLTRYNRQIESCEIAQEPAQNQNFNT